MTTPFNDAIDQIATDFLALTPPDRTDVTYTHLGDTLEATDRGFFFEPGNRVVVEEVAGSGVTRCQWDTTATLMLSILADGKTDLREAVTNEMNTFARAVERRSTWPSGVLEVWTGDSAPAGLDQELGLARVNLNLFMLTEETD